MSQQELSLPVNLRDVWDFDDPAGSERRFDQLLIDESSGDLQRRAEILSQKARAQGLQRRFEEARATLTSAESLLSPEFSRGRANVELEMGRVDNSSGNPESARAHFLKALDVAEAAGLDFLAIDAAHMLGIVDKGEESLKWSDKAIALAQSTPDPRARNWLGSLLNNTGWTYYDMGRLDKALDLFEQAVVFRETQAKPKEVRIARYCVAKCHRALGHVEQALEMQREIEEEISPTDEPGYVFEEIGECLLALGRAEEAKPYFARAYECLSHDEWLLNSEPERVGRLKRLSE